MRRTLPSYVVQGLLELAVHIIVNCNEKEQTTFISKSYDVRIARFPARYISGLHQNSHQKSKPLRSVDDKEVTPVYQADDYDGMKFAYVRCRDTNSL